MLADDHILLLNTAAASIAISRIAICTPLLQCRILFASQKLSNHNSVTFSYLHVHMRNKFTTTAQAQPAGSNEMAAWLTGYFSSLLLAKTWSIYKGVWRGWRGFGFNGRHGMGWNSFSLPAFFYPFFNPVLPLPLSPRKMKLCPKGRKPDEMG